MHAAVESDAETGDAHAEPVEPPAKPVDPHAKRKEATQKGYNPKHWTRKSRKDFLRKHLRQLHAERIRMQKHRPKEVPDREGPREVFRAGSSYSAIVYVPLHIDDAGYFVQVPANGIHRKAEHEDRESSSHINTLSNNSGS